MSKQKIALPIVILISGNGSNLQAIIDAIASNKLNAEIRAVISNRDDAYGLKRARLANIPTEILLNKDYPTREAYDAALQKKLEQYQPQLIVLAGFMRILGKQLIHHYHGRLINIHPSLLPKHRGLHTHQRVLDAGEKEHGVTIHYVTEELDSGPIIAQEKIRVEDNDTTESLQQKIQQLEHRLYPQVIQQLAENFLNPVPLSKE
jgi:phosphoribosylglycinamide formyltransferase-1